MASHMIETALNKASETIAAWRSDLYCAKCSLGTIGGKGQ